MSEQKDEIKNTNSLEGIYMAIQFLEECLIEGGKEFQVFIRAQQTPESTDSYRSDYMRCINKCLHALYLKKDEIVGFQTLAHVIPITDELKRLSDWNAQNIYDLVEMYKQTYEYEEWMNKIGEIENLKLKIGYLFRAIMALKDHGNEGLKA